ncbi:MAG: hypothetical protein HOB14_13205 [Gammaproteobacteria bacterium]|jgi:hypothetical protein|nr:hypothetical protein [Gammaproteobacteria bacterium]MBT6702612.1 hypothetical protein [Gammaproteobacteria bacterium]
MKFNRLNKRHWVSECGLYNISSTGIVAGMTYAARYMRPAGTYDQLGKFIKGTAQQNADSAKQACSKHAERLAANDREAGQGKG